MIQIINWIKSNICNVRYEDSYALMMDKKTNVYYLSLDTGKFILYILDNDTNVLLNEISSAKIYNENQLIDLESKIKTFLNAPKNTSGPLDENIKKQLAVSTRSLRFKAPVYTSFQILDVCNLKCIHCYTDSKNDNNKFMSLDDAKLIMDKLSSAGVFMLGITGGETLLHPNLLDIIKYGASKRLLVNINSNGTLLTHDLARKLKESGLTSLKISIDGRKEHHNFIRRSDTAFDKSIEALKIAKETGLNPEIYYVVFKNNLEDIDYMLDLAESLDVNINVRRFIPIGRGSNERALMLNGDDVKYLLSRINEHPSDRITIDRCYVYGERRGNCHICNKTVTSITKNGDFFTCPYIQLDELKLGNIFNESFEEIFSKIDKHIFLDFNQSDLSEPCNDCNDFDICYGGCRATSYVCNNKERYGLDPQCSKVYQKLKLVKNF